MDLLTSKKFIASALAAILALAGFALALPVEQVLTVIAPLTGYTLAQGIADHGKEAAKITNGDTDPS